MADLKNTGNTPAVSADADNNTPHAFNFADMGSLLHAAAYLGAVQPLAATPRQFHDYAAAMLAVESAAACLSRTHKGLELLLEMLCSTAGVDRYTAESLHGLLGPLALQLEHHADALAATIASKG